MKIALIDDGNEALYTVQALDAALRRFDHEIVSADDPAADITLTVRPNGLALINEDESETHIPCPTKLGALLDQLSGIDTRILPETIRLGRHVFRPATSEFIFAGAEEAVRLTEKERDMLLYLYHHMGRDVPRAELLTAVWGYVDGIETHTLETHIYRLRQKIEADPENAHLLVKSENGYCLVDQGDS